MIKLNCHILWLSICLQYEGDIEGKGRLMLKEGPSMIFISQTGEHIHCGLDKDRRREWKGSASPGI